MKARHTRVCMSLQWVYKGMQWILLQEHDVINGNTMIINE